MLSLRVICNTCLGIVHALVEKFNCHLALQFSAAIPGIVYALLGSSRQLNVAPEAALSLLVGQAVSNTLHSDPHDHPANPDAVGLAVASAIVIQVRLSTAFLNVY